MQARCGLLWQGKELDWQAFEDLGRRDARADKDPEAGRPERDEFGTSDGGSESCGVGVSVWIFLTGR